MTWQHPSGELAKRVARYQREPGEAAARALLTQLEEDIVREARRWRPPRPAVDFDDVRQQMRLNVLLVARRISPYQEDRWLRRRIFQKAHKRMAAWLVREQRHQHELLTDRVPAPAPVPELNAVIPKVRDHDLLYAYHVAGVPLWVLSQQRGIGYTALKKRISRARKLAAHEVQKSLRTS